METRSKRRRKAAGPLFSPLQSPGDHGAKSNAAPKALSLSPRTPSPREAAASPCEPYTQWHVVVRSLPAPATRTFTIDLADDKPDARIALGRSRIQSDLVVNSRFAQTSRLHCTFRVAGRGAQSTVVVDDACSLNGLYVNERRVRSARLRTGDTLILGTVEDSVGVDERLDRRKLTPEKTAMFEVVCVRSIERPGFRSAAMLPPGGTWTRVSATITGDAPLGLELSPQGESVVVTKIRAGAVKSLSYPRVAPGLVLESVSSLPAEDGGRGPARRTRQNRDVVVRASPRIDWVRRLEAMPRPLHLVLSRLAYDILGRLPVELVNVVLDKLRVVDLCAFAQCSRRCRHLVDRDRIWRHRCEELWKGKIAAAVDKPERRPAPSPPPRGASVSTCLSSVLVLVSCQVADSLGSRVSAERGDGTSGQYTGRSARRRQGQAHRQRKAAEGRCQTRPAEALAAGPAAAE